jgi:hypothetical protein
LEPGKLLTDSELNMEGMLICSEEGKIKDILGTDGVPWAKAVGMERLKEILVGVGRTGGVPSKRLPSSDAKEDDSSLWPASVSFSFLSSSSFCFLLYSLRYFLFPQ